MSRPKYINPGAQFREEVVEILAEVATCALCAVFLFTVMKEPYSVPSFFVAVSVVMFLVRTLGRFVTAVLRRAWRYFWEGV